MQVRYLYTTHVSPEYGLEGHGCLKTSEVIVIKIATFFQLWKIYLFKNVSFFKYRYGYNLAS